MEHLVKADLILTANGFEHNRLLRINDGTVTDIKYLISCRSLPNIEDLTGYVLVPGLCDYHLHFFRGGPVSDEAKIDLLVSKGITKVFEGGDSGLHAFRTKTAFKNIIDIRTAGSAVYRMNTYGEYIGKGVRSVGEAKELMERLHKGGADYIKVVNSGIFRPETGEITRGGFEESELREIVRHAREMGLDTACHANGERAVKEAVEAGVSTLIHGLYVSEDTLSAMAEKRVNFIPTVNAFLRLETIASDNISRRNIENAVEGHICAIKSALNKGVNVLPGSDSGASFIPYGEAYHEELMLFRKAGLSVEDILLKASAGAFENGGKGDFLALKGLKIEKVFRNGVMKSMNKKIEHTKE